MAHAEKQEDKIRKIGKNAYNEKYKEIAGSTDKEEGLSSKNKGWKGFLVGFLFGVIPAFIGAFIGTRKSQYNEEPKSWDSNEKIHGKS
jgi:hypothetical protein